MTVDVYPTASAAARSAAGIVARQLKRRPTAVLGLPTGHTSAGIYEELIRLYRAHRVDFARAHTVNLDEFAGIASADPRSFHAFMAEHLFRRVNLPKSHIHFLNGQPDDVVRECLRFERRIAELGGIELQLLGLGENGHIGFNEPGDSLHARTHAARLSPATRRANADRFGGRARSVPRQALTLGMATILSARAIVLVATGRHKARAVGAMINGDLSTRCPASFLQLHPDARVLLDRDAAAEL